MCGIVGVLGQESAAPAMLEALRRLEYRGYDSAGVAVLVAGKLERRRAAGKLANLEAALEAAPLEGVAGIGHTRWATHGAATETNAHPHQSGPVAVVHNGIIENFLVLREELEAEGMVFETETDTEVIARLVHHLLGSGLTPELAVRKALTRLEGAFALAFLFEEEPDLMIAARRGSPLAIGLGEGAIYVGSDALALAPMTNRVIYLEDGDMALLRRDEATITTPTGTIANRPVKLTNVSSTLVDKGAHKHFMAKEIFEQPEVIAHALGRYVLSADETVSLPDLPVDLADIKRITIIACGTAAYAGFVAKYWLEQIAKVPVEVDIASEYRYREPVLEPGTLCLAISQSGETADTLAALRYCKEGELAVGAIVNVQESTIAREADFILPIYAGPEIGVASTKAFTCQLTVLAVFTIALARARGQIDEARAKDLTRLLQQIPRRITDLLQTEEDIAEIARDLSKASNALFLGRGIQFPLALEGALKLKEISYIHAEGYAAGELKHGPIALVDEDMPVIAIAPFDGLFEKTVSNLQEVVAREGRVILISDEAGLAKAGALAERHIRLPAVDPFIAPILCAVPVQLLAYHTAVTKGTDVDQPRNLAKSVTVE